MTSSAEVCVAEAYNGIVAMLVAGTILIDFSLIFTIHIVWNGVCVGRELYDTERYASTRESVAHSVCANNWIYIFDDVLTVNSQA